MCWCCFVFCTSVVFFLHSLIVIPSSTRLLLFLVLHFCYCYISFYTSVIIIYGSTCLLLLLLILHICVVITSFTHLLQLFNLLKNTFLSLLIFSLTKYMFTFPQVCNCSLNNSIWYSLQSVYTFTIYVCTKFYTPYSSDALDMVIKSKAKKIFNGIYVVLYFF